MSAINKQATNPLLKPAVLALSIAQTLLLAVPVSALAADDKMQSDLLVTAHEQATNSYTTEQSSAATGMAMSLRETPQSVSAITRQRIQDQGLQSLDDVLLNTTGITLQQLDNSGRITYRARGFDIHNFKTDGLTTNYNNGGDGHASAANLALYDHVEIIRGANGLPGGSGDPSATVNLVRKMPKKQAATSIGLTYGSYDKRRAFADVNAPLAFDGRVRSRFVISGEDSGSWRDRSGSKNFNALASLSVDLSDSTLLNTGVQYDKNRTDGASWGANVPVWYADGSFTHLPRSFNPVPVWAHSQTRSNTYFASIEQFFAGEWKSKLAYSHNDANIIYDRSVVKANNNDRDPKKRNSDHIDGYLNQDGTGGYLNAEYSDYDTKEDDLAWTVNGIFHLFGRSHELMGGINYYRLVSTQYGFAGNFNGISGNCGIADFHVFAAGKCQYRADPNSGIPIDNVFSWNGTGIPDFNAWRTDARTLTTTTHYGGYLAGRFSLTDPLSAIIGLRLSNYKIHVEDHSYDKKNNMKNNSSTANNNGVVTPYAGLIFDISENYTVYASYTSIFNPQLGKGNAPLADAQGKQIAPITGNSYEAGVKAGYFNGRLNASLALFSEQQKNVATKVDDDIYQANANGITSKGVELDISGAITDNWNIYLGYTCLNVDNPGIKRSKTTGTAALDDPRHLFRLFTTYRLPGMLDSLTIGGGISAQSYTSNIPSQAKRPPALKDDTPLKLKGYALVDVMARYQFNKNVGLTFNVDNLFDSTYYRQRGFYGGQIFGAPRTYWATLNIRY